MRDADVPGWWQRLGLPGLADIHVHFMPEPLLNAVWRYFDDAHVHYGVAWPVQYRTSDAERLATLERLGVRTFPALLYPHKPGMAESLNAWAREFADGTPGCVRSGTFFPEPGAGRYVRAALDAGTRVFKAHVQVGGYDPRDPLLDGVWGLLADAGMPVVVHCGSGPAPGRFTGPEPMREVLRRHPALTVVIAHMGMPEYDDFLGFAETYTNVHVDTTMCFTDSFGSQDSLGRELAPRLASLQEKVVFGADFPNIPHPYAHQLEVLARLGLGDDWLRAVCWHNGARLLRVSR